MSLPKEHTGRYFFHFTHLENLDSIVKNGLLCTNKKNEEGINHINVASEGIQARRSSMKVPCGPKGKIHDYVPFYFCSVNPMFLSMINSKNVDQQFVIIFAISIEKILDKNVVFTDASANTFNPPNYFTDPQYLNKLDWETIDSKSWGCADDDERHRKMAEVLIFEKVPISLIDKIIVWNKGAKEMVEKIFKDNNINPPPIVFSLPRYKFHFTKFMIPGRDGESLTTGPYTLKSRYKGTIKKIIEKRKSTLDTHNFPFLNIAECLKKLDKNFSAIPELQGIYQLETINDVHSDNVSDHTVNVVEQLERLRYYQSAEIHDQNILKLAAYLHDIGKGPKSKWSKGKQPAYPDHPADAPKMLERILVEDFKNISPYEIRMICLLVTYHDLIGEIFGKGRNQQQLIEIIEDEKDFDMLSTLNYADVSAINFVWRKQFASKIKEFKETILTKLSKK